MSNCGIHGELQFISLLPKLHDGWGCIVDMSACDEDDRVRRLKGSLEAGDAARVSSRRAVKGPRLSCSGIKTSAWFVLINLERVLPRLTTRFGW